MSDPEHPLLSVPSLTAHILRSVPADPAAIARALAGLLAKASAPDPDPDGTERRIRALCAELAIAGLVVRDDGRYALTDEGRAALEEHPQGLDRADLAAYPAYAAHLHATGDEKREDPHGAAWLEGAAARVAGASATENPFPPDTADHGAWEDGWSETDPAAGP